ncbi:PTS sugar transporter subunit IIA [bacterium]|nr:PTS sugar transporter subunit IIA [bacterium]
MNLSAFTGKRYMSLDVEAGSKQDVLSAMVTLLAASPEVSNGDTFLGDVLAREELVTTGVGYGVAFPHAKSSAVRDVVFAFGRTRGNVDFGALDGVPVRLVFLIGAPKEQEPSRIYLNLMARLSFLMKDEKNRKALLEAGSVAEALRVIDSVK